MTEKLGLAMRDKYWNERNIDEKVSALYDEVCQLRYQITTAQSMLEKMIIHSHADGKVVTPIESETRREYYIPIALQRKND